MGQAIVKTLRMNISIKFISLILGYFFWAIFSQSRPITVSLDVPISFYNIPKNIQILAPEALKVMLSGKRIYFDTLDISSLAFHVDAHGFKKGKYPLYISNKHLFLPDEIKLLNYTPSPLIIQINTKE